MAFFESHVVTFEESHVAPAEGQYLKNKTIMVRWGTPEPIRSGRGCKTLVSHRSLWDAMAVLDEPT